MTKRMLWYVCLGLLCCLATTLVVSAADNMLTPEKRARIEADKAARIAPTTVTANPQGNTSNAGGTPFNTPNPVPVSSVSIPASAAAATDYSTTGKPVEVVEAWARVESGNPLPGDKELVAQYTRNPEIRPVNPLDQGMDACPGTVIPSLPYTDSGTTSGYVNDVSTCGPNTAPDVIYAYTAVNNNTIRFSLCGSAYDTRIEVRSGGACPGSVQNACNDDFCGLQSQVDWGVTAGTTYYVIVDGFSSSSGSYTLNVTDLGGGLRPCNVMEPQDAILTMTNTPWGGMVDGNCGNGGKWVGEFTAVAQRFYHFDLCPDAPGNGSNNFDPDLKIVDANGTILAGEDGSCSAWAWSSNDFMWQAPANGTYYAVIAPYYSYNSHTCNGTSSETFHLEYYWSEPVLVECPPGAIQENEPICADEYVDNTNGGCNNATPIFQPWACGQTICGESGTYLFTGLNYRDTDWFELTVTTAQTITYTVTAEFPVLIFTINSPCPATIRQQAQAGPNAPATITDNLLPGTYYLWVGPSVFSGVACGSAWVGSVTCAPYDPIGRCCYGDPYAPSCQDVTASVCAGLSGTWDGTVSCATSICPAILDCPPGSIMENEPVCADEYVDNWNGGCNSATPVFQPIACGQTMCGESGTYLFTGSSYRDTDWLELTITTPKTVTWSVTSSFDLLIFTINSPCPAAIRLSATAPANGTATIVDNMYPGTYYLWVGPSVFSGVPCGSEWIGTVTCVDWQPPAGRCCYLSAGQPACADITLTECNALGGNWDEELTCAGNPCPVPCAPGNDNCGGITIITACPFSCEGTTSGYVNDFSTCGPNTAPDRIYQITTQQTSNIHVDLCGSLYDTRLEVRSGGACPGTTQVGCNDDSQCGLQSSLDLPNQPAGTYYIIVDGYSSGSGVYTLNVTADPCFTGACEEAENLTVYRQTGPGANVNLRWLATQSVGTYKVWGTDNKNNDGDPDNGADPDWVLVATVPAPATPGPLTATDALAPSPDNYRNYVVVHDCAPVGRCCYGDPLNPQCQSPLTAAQCAALGGNWTGGTTCANPCPIVGLGETCANPIPLTIGTQVTGSTTGYVHDYDYACPYTGSTSPDVVYSFTAAAADQVTFSLCVGNTDYDTKLFIYANDCSTTPVACNDDACSSPVYASWVSRIDCFQLVAGTTYYVVIDGYGGDAGTYYLDTQVCTPPPPLECPPGATMENEPMCADEYVDATNGGCNSTPNVFQNISCGQTYCGESGTYLYTGLSYRDTDWFQLTVSTTTTVTWTVQAGFPFYIFTLDGVCPTTLRQQGQGNANDVVSITDTMAPGTYFVWVGPSVFTGVPCGTEWVGTLTCQ